MLCPVLLLISEIFGSVNGQAKRFLTRLAHMAKKTEAETYFDASGRPVSFFNYHARATSSAAVLGHGSVLLKLAATVRANVHRMRSLAARAQAGDATAAAHAGGPERPRTRGL